MPYEPFNLDRLREMKDMIEQHIYVERAPLTVNAWVTKEPVAFEDRMSGKPVQDLKPGSKWGELWDCAWFHFEGTVPAESAGQKVVLLIDVNGELCLVDEEGTPRQGLTNVNSEFETALGKPGKRVVLIAEQAQGGEAIDVWGDAGCNDLFGRYHSGTLKEAVIATCREQVRGLYYDVEVLLELGRLLPEDSSRRAQILQALYEASLIFSEHFTDEEVARARALLAPQLAKKGGDPTLTVSAVGHAHMDLAWLWPIRETIRKGARTFATVLRMMERYPDYVFGASQPQLYQWIKEHYPKLYEEIKERIQEGRWELQGAMWVEPDSNVSGGEALIRQILYGQRFYQEEFGQTVKSLWVPDIFGYTASLPQLLKKSGIQYMVTQKLSWNQYNDYPHHTFFWEGIDGSKVLTHLPPEDTYNSPAAPRSLIKIDKEYHDKNVSDRALMLFGIGDGGGGPGEEHLERLERERNLLGLPPVVQEPSAVFLERLNEQRDRYKTWRGELYLEKHQGTLTTQGKNKRYNRLMEKALRELEFAAVLAKQLCGIPYPQQELEQIWKETLLYQFHDILPGSSIKRVYDESVARYEVLLDQTESLIAERYEAIAAHASGGAMGKVVLFNSLPWERKEWLSIGGKWQHVQVPPMGYSVVAPSEDAPQTALSASTQALENELLKAEFSADGTIVSILDKRHGRELLRAGEPANVLTLYDDRGGDAWDFRGDYRSRPSSQLRVTSVQAGVDGAKAYLEQTYVFGSSQLIQTISLTAGSERLDFDTKVHWQENQKMLRAAFPLDVRAGEVTSEIQFGYLKRPLHRNTSWDFARDEICAHHWIDLSESGYGVSILNDSKYGYRADEYGLDINLLRSPGYPDETADRGEHEFTYALFPHEGDAAAAAVYKAGYELNVPLRAVSAAAQIQQVPEGAPASFSVFEVNHSQVMIEAVKQAEDSEAVIVRLYETSGSRAVGKLKLHLPAVSAAEVNLMEQKLAEAAITEGSVDFTMKPFEIKTYQFDLK
ncbi:glycoside hydrolase family protein [Paenibacillus algicola]|uniref:Glycoside hydrolase family protein n=1 Tax=Paenibacillus algicola TaxID=2565926 RepID=A0A4V1G476_9BACL|nr:glycoside hydrolase family 38 C-terminal domain-containing protein [Paenibacillus algicola]QCT03724.1 glycoside hydrolase family protein [Paenibacillus algicola]